MQFYIDTNICILLLLFIELNLFFNTSKNLIIHSSSLFKFMTNILILFNKSGNFHFIISSIIGIGIFFKESYNDKVLKIYLTSLIILAHIHFQLFIYLKLAFIFYIIIFLIYIQVYGIIFVYSLRNIIFLFNIYFKIKKIKRYNKYREVIGLKLCILVIQFIIYFFYALFILFIHEYLLFKQGIFFDNEKNILFQCLDGFLLLINGFIYLPSKFLNGFEFYISFTKYQIKKNVINVYPAINYQSNIPKEILINEKEFKEFKHKNLNRYFSIFNPKAFLYEEKDNKNINLIKKNIKLGKII